MNENLKMLSWHQRLNHIHPLKPVHQYYDYMHFSMWGKNTSVFTWCWDPPWGCRAFMFRWSWDAWRRNKSLHEPELFCGFNKAPWSFSRVAFCLKWNQTVLLNHSFMFQYQARMTVCCSLHFKNKSSDANLNCDSWCTTDFHTTWINYRVKMIVILTLKQAPVLSERVAGWKAL